MEQNRRNSYILVLEINSLGEFNATRATTDLPQAVAWKTAFSVEQRSKYYRERPRRKEMLRKVVALKIRSAM